MLDKAAPDFTLPATGNPSFSLSSLRGQKVVLYFYPKDSTPGCTTESQNFRDLHEAFVATGAVVLGMVYNYVPYMILPLYTSMTKIDQSLVEAAQDLGASTTKTLVRVLIPMSVPGISTGITMVFVPAVSTFVISRMLGGGSNLLIGDLIEMQFLGNSYNLNVGSAMSLVLMIIVLLCMSFTSSFDEDEMEGVS